jgi:[ribosomal protein S5]-alanine N-acetyltransferase
MNVAAPWQAPPLTTRIVTDRLVLRLPRSVDVPELRRALRANAEHLRPWQAIPPRGEDPTSLTSVSRTVARHRREWKRGQSLSLVISPRANEAHIVGRIALTGLLLGAFRNGYLGYWVDASCQRGGLATEAVVAVTTFAFRTGGLHRVQAAVMPSNAASARVLTKARYRQEGLALRYLSIAGRWEDHLIFAVTVEEWT